MINFKVRSIDGFGDRDRQQDQRNTFLDIDLAVNAATEWGTSSKAKPVSQIIEEMIQGEIWEKLILKSEVIWDTETLGDALTESCIRLGLSDEDFAPSYHDLGNEIDLRLF